MAKILLVEDDNNLREIYEARLQAEGYEIVAAPDGEAALVVAKKENPDLVISDVMMPNVSGFEMLDIIRNTDGLKNIKVIMLTALGQAEDKAKADNLGADRYLVKSQVTLEDIVKAASELLSESQPAPTPAATGVATAAQPTTSPAPDPAAAPTPAPVTPVTAAVPVTPAPTIPAATPPEPATPAPQPATPVAVTPEPAATPASATPQPTPVTPAPEPPSTPPAAPATVPSVPAPEPATPPTPAPVPSATPAVITSDQLMAAAVKDLISGATPPAAPAASAAPAPEPVAPAPTQPSASAPVPALPEPPATQSEEEAAAPKKRIIQPLAPEDSGSEKPGLQELLAKEGMSPMGDGQAATQDPAAADDSHHATMPHPPGHVISPNPTNAAGQPIDPNSIAL